jgi:choice-of-anchor A domain-containing protein
MRKPSWSLLCLIAMLATGGTSAAVACPAGVGTPVAIQDASVATLLCDFNAIVDGQFISTSDVQGPVLIGGNLGPGTVALNDNGVVLGTNAGTTAITGYGEVDVFGNQTAAFNPAKGNVFVGGTVAAVTPFPGATSVTSGYTFPPGASPADNPTTFQNNIWSKMTGLSATLALLSSSSAVSGGMFTGVANVNGVAVFNITLAQLNAITGSLSLAGCLAGPTPCDAVINVIGAGSFTQNFNWGTIGSAQQNLIWNFEGATALNIDNEWWASILATAPGAVVTNTAPIVGNLIATIYGGPAPLGSGELHDFPFDCSDNLCASSVILPEPGPLAALGSALAMFAALASIAAIRRCGCQPKSPCASTS